MNQLLAYLALFGVLACMAAGQSSSESQSNEGTSESQSNDSALEIQPNDGANIERPCGSSNIDRECVREFFEENGDGEVVTETDDEPVLRERYITYFNKINTTVVDTQTLLSGLDGVVEDFYINRDTGNLVFTVFFQNASFETPEAYFYITRRGQEPLFITSLIEATYPPVALTAIIPLNDGRVTEQSLRDGTVTSFLERGVFPFRLGPAIMQTTQPEVIRVVNGLLLDFSTASQEIFHTAGPGVFLAYLQKYIANFGIPLTEGVMITPPANPPTGN